MSAEDFRAWLRHMEMDQTEAAKALGLPSKHAITRYAEHGAPLLVGLACAALAWGLPSWRGNKAS